ncbi:MAG: hypothetical protein NMNS01_06750 [Nitrosomonas sp.]|nr:MAG: hypothetical protein NMNS01_06750 [Nitrosomonas sp.]
MIALYYFALQAYRLIPGAVLTQISNNLHREHDHQFVNVLIQKVENEEQE